MCGIIWIHRFDNGYARRALARAYDKQRARGQEGFGFLALEKGVVKKFCKSESDSAIMGEIHQRTEDEILFHHRNPTSTPNMLEAAHPILVSHEKLKYNWYVVHNGTITGTIALREKHLKEGYEYRTELTKCYRSKEGRILDGGVVWNDSESFAIELVKDLEGERAGLGGLTGGISFVAIQVDKETKQAIKTYWGRNSGSPLVLERNKYMVSITSVGAGADFTVHRLGSYDYATEKVEDTNYICGYATSYTSNYHENYYDDKTYDYELHKWVTKSKVSPLLNPPKKEKDESEARMEKDVDKIMDISDKLKKAEAFLLTLPTTDKRRKPVSAQISKMTVELAELSGKYRNLSLIG